MEERGPHLWGRLPSRYYPSLITVLGPAYWLLVKVPEEIYELPEYEQLQEVGAFARFHYENHRRCRLDGYNYRRNVHEVDRFDVEGNYEGRIDLPLSGPCFLRFRRSRRGLIDSDRFLSSILKKRAAGDGAASGR